MSVQLPSGAKELLDQNTYVVLSTVRGSGSPESSVVWAARDGDDVLITTIEGAPKVVNIGRDDRVTVCFFNPDKPGEAYTVYGTATLSTDDAEEVARRNSAKYVPGRSDPVAYLRHTFGTPTSRVVLIRITPDHVKILNRAKSASD